MKPEQLTPSGGTSSDLYHSWGRELFYDVSFRHTEFLWRGFLLKEHKAFHEDPFLLLVHLLKFGSHSRPSFLAVFIFFKEVLEAH